MSILSDGTIRRLIASGEIGSNPRLREMATGVLNGDLGLRDAAASDVYSDAIGSTFNTFWTKYQDMTPEERTDLIGQGYDYIEQAE